MRHKYSCVALYKPINEYNVGHVLRAAYCFNVKLVVLQTNKPISPHAPTNTTKTECIIALL